MTTILINYSMLWSRDLHAVMNTQLCYYGEWPNWNAVSDSHSEGSAHVIIFLIDLKTITDYIYVFLDVCLNRLFHCPCCR